MFLKTPVFGHGGSGFQAPNVPVILTPPVVGYMAWYDAQQVNATDGSSVTSWADLTGSYPATQGTPANQPKFYKSTPANLINGHPAILFDGVATYLSTLTPVLTTPISLFCVVKLSVTDTNNKSVAGPSSGHSFLFSTSTNWITFFPSAMYGPTASATTNPIAITAVISPITSPPSFVQTDSAILTTATAYTASDTGYMIGGNWGGTNQTVPGNYFPGLIGELILYPFALTTAQANSMHTYAQTKWGTP